MTVAALYVLNDGPYAGLEGVDIWPESRDARDYAGPHAVVAHPPCERWGRYWFGGPSCKTRRTRGDDGGRFRSALAAVRRFGGVIEHPAHTSAWHAHDIAKPDPQGGWSSAGLFHQYARVCHVEQGHYGHPSRKATWLYAVSPGRLPELSWGVSQARVRMDAGYYSARERRERSRNDVIEVLSKRQRALTPNAFRDVLLGIAQGARLCQST